MTDTIKPARRARRMAREPETAQLAAPIASGQNAGGEPVTPGRSSPEAERNTKSSQVLTMLQRPEGASLDDLVALTGWLPHTTRAALTGLRKKGFHIASEKTESGVRIYYIADVAEVATDKATGADA
jgi:hypothetical protein